MATRLAAENSNPITSPDQHWETARVAVYLALRATHFPDALAEVIASQTIERGRELALPHIVAGTVEVGEGITIDGQPTPPTGQR